MKRLLRFFLLSLFVPMGLVVSGCSKSFQSLSEQERAEFSATFPNSLEETQDAARMAVVDVGYVPEFQDRGIIKASRTSGNSDQYRKVATITFVADNQGTRLQVAGFVLETWNTKKERWIRNRIENNVEEAQIFLDGVLSRMEQALGPAIKPSSL